jgi:acyl-CoA synthetase (AMP-forming)/AMP-acid ligase II
VQLNISMLLEMVAGAGGDRVVLGTSRDGLTGPALLAAARRAAERFGASGGQYVAMLDVNSTALPVTLFGAAIAGLPFVPINYRLTDEQLAGILPRVAPGVIVVGDDTAGRVSGVDGLDAVRREGLLEDPSTSDGGEEAEWVDPESIAVLLFTSGTTGEPKAAVLRHRHLVSYVIGSVEFLGCGERRMVYLPGFDPDQWVRTAAEERITHAMVVPTMLGRILDRIDAGNEDLSSLRHISYGGGRMPVEVIERAMKVLPDVDFVNAYGLTETSSTIAVLTPQDHRDALSSGDRESRSRLGSVGRALPTVEVSIRDADGRPVEAGQRGEVWVRGEQVSGEYLGRSTLTEDGWFRTRDAGWVDAEGFLFLDGRLDDVIVRGGENLSPGEIEDTLASHPAVAEAAVVGIPDPEWGETVAAAVVLEPGASASEAELQEWVKSRLRSTKAPQVIRFRDEMPYNETGKLLRRVIRQELASRD